VTVPQAEITYGTEAQREDLQNWPHAGELWSHSCPTAL